MTAIPEDVRERAEALCHEICALFSVYDDTGASFDYGTAESLIAALILSEREAAQREERARCAEVAREQTRALCRGDFGLHGPAGMGLIIAAAILQEPKE